MKRIGLLAAGLIVGFVVTAVLSILTWSSLSWPS